MAERRNGKKRRRGEKGGGGKMRLAFFLVSLSAASSFASQRAVCGEEEVGANESRVVVCLTLDAMVAVGLKKEEEEEEKREIDPNGVQATPRRPHPPFSSRPAPSQNSNSAQLAAAPPSFFFTTK